MRIVMTGANGVVGRYVVALLARDGMLGGKPISELVLSDRMAPARPDAPFPVRTLACEVRDASAVERLLAERADLIIHLAAVMSGTAERDYALGWEVNVNGLQNLLEAARKQDLPPRFIFTSSPAVYGESAPDPVPDVYAARPRNAYGTQKLIGELMVTEYSRRGFVDGRVLRLPGIAIRPSETHQGAAAFITMLVRNPLLHRRGAICPVPRSTRISILTPKTAAACVAHLARLQESEVADARVIQAPALTLTVQELLDAVGRAGGPGALAHVTDRIDAELVDLRRGIPVSFEARRASELGFPRPLDADAVIDEFLEDVGLSRAQVTSELDHETPKR